MRKDSTGSIGHAFYSSNDKITPNKEKGQLRSKVVSKMLSKQDEQDALEAQSSSDWLLKSLREEQDQHARKPASRTDISNDASEQSNERKLASSSYALPDRTNNKRSSVSSTVSDDSLRYSSARDVSLLPSNFMSTIEGLTAEDYGMHTKRSSEMDIAAFSAMALSPDISTAIPQVSSRPPRPKPVWTSLPSDDDSDDYDGDDDDINPVDDSEWTNDDDEDEDPDDWWDFLAYWFNPTGYLMYGAKLGPDNKPYFDHTEEHWWSLAATVRHVFYNPLEPEFTSLQQFSWAVIIGVVMGIYVSVWKTLIEGGVEFMWKTLPAELLRLGIFTDLNGSFPLYHYMWICPAVWGGILSYIFVILPFQIPDQNEWITGVHSKGILDHRGFGALFVLSTLAMMSGLSLGPELPLVLTAGMVGSWFGLVCKQSMLQARVMNLTAASAAVGGFFGFPMAGAMFVLEIPHRMGLQYFEALSPATISSIVAVLTNRLIINNDVTGYYSYPFLSASLPSEIFTSAIVYGLYGALLGLIYGKGALLFKGYVHDFFQAPHGHHSVEGQDSVMEQSEETPLVVSSRRRRKKRRATTPVPTLKERIFGFGCVFIKEEKKRAALAGFVAGGLVGAVGMFLPHTMFWGEAQLQNLIDKGRTPLPIFTTGDEPTAALTSLAICMIDPKDHHAVLEGFGIGCSFLITFAKIFVVGLSLGTGIIGGHFWGPLFCGCAAAHLFTDVFEWLSANYGVGGSLSAYPCVAILCTMGSAHVVTYRAHMAIMLILTLTISAFNPQNETEGVGVVGVSGDYSAVFPLLVVSVFVALMVSRSFVFYSAQRSRGDILAVPEVLCEPGMKGRPAVVEYVDGDEDINDDGYAYMTSNPKELTPQDGASTSNYLREADYRAANDRIAENTTTQLEIEWQFAKTNAALSRESNTRLDGNENFHAATSSSIEPLSSARLDELLREPLENSSESPKTGHRRFHSAPAIPRDAIGTRSTSPKRPQSGNRERADSGSNLRKHMLRITSYGEIHDHQPSLLDQARERSASSATESLHRRVASTTDAHETRQRHRRIPSLPGLPRKSSTDASVGSHNDSGRKLRHRRKNSTDSIDSDIMEDTGALSLDDIEQSFDDVVAARQPDFQGSMWTENSLS